jgi:hypothetical protein
MTKKPNHSWTRVLVLAGALALSGVAQANMSKLAFDRANAQGIQTIDVLDVVQLQPLVVMPRQTSVKGTPPVRSASATGAMGATANPAPTLRALNDSAAKVNAAFQRSGNSLPLVFGKQLVDALRSAGYDAKVLHDQQPNRSSIGARQKIDGVKSQSDAVLYVVLRFAGYKDDAASGGVVPTVGVDAYLFNAKDGTLLYRQVFDQGFGLVKGPDVESLPVPGLAKFASNAALGANGDGAARGLVDALQPVAARIAQQLGR